MSVYRLWVVDHIKQVEGVTGVYAGRAVKIGGTDTLRWHQERNMQRGRQYCSIRRSRPFRLPSGGGTK